MQRNRHERRSIDYLPLPRISRDTFNPSRRPQTVFTVFGSPYSPATQKGKWAAFGYGRDDEKPTTTTTQSSNPNDRNSNTGGSSCRLWDQIPPDTDVVVTHTPAYSHRDRHSQATATSGDDGQPARPVGCPALRQVLQRVRPKIAVCGHVHESRGCERVLWPPPPPPPLMTRGEDTGGQVEEMLLPPIGSRKQSLVDLTGRRAGGRMATATAAAMAATSATAPAAANAAAPGNDSDHAIPATTRQRRETCIVNAAILATSWPHRGGKRFHPPVLVDVDLPAADTV